MKAETGGGWVCTALWGRQISHTILSSKRNLRAVTCLFGGGQSCSPPSHPLSSQPLSSQSIMEKPNHHELRAWHRQEFQNSWSLMDHSDPVQAPCKAAAPPLQHRQGRMSTASLGCLSRTLNHRKLGWLSVLLFIYYFAQSTAPGYAISGFQTPLWAAPCCGLQLSAVLCTLVLQELQCSPTPTSTLAHLALQDRSTLELLWSPQFFSSWIPDAACKLHSISYMMFQRWMKNPLNQNYRRAHTGAPGAQQHMETRHCPQQRDPFTPHRAIPAAQISLQAAQALTSMMLSLSTLEPTWYSADVSWYKSPASTEV